MNRCAARAQRAVARRRRAGRPGPRGGAHGPLLAVPHQGARDRRRPRRSGQNPRFHGLPALRRRRRDARRPSRSAGAGRPAASAVCAHRESPGVAGGYLANGCIECDALIGRFQLEDLLHEHLQSGGTYAPARHRRPRRAPGPGAGAPPQRRTPSANAPANLHRNPSISRAIWVFGSAFARMAGIPSTRTGFRPSLGMSHVQSPPSLPFLCQLLSRNGRSPSVRSPRASSSSPCARAASAKSASTSRSSTTASSSIRRSNTSATTSFAPRTSPSCGAPSRRACGPTPSRPPRR